MDAVIKLPRGVLSYTGVDSVILVLKKHRYTKDIKFVYADDCIISDGRNKKLNYQAVIERLEKTGSRILATANCGGIEITVEFGGKIQYTLKEGSETTAYEESE